MIEGYKKRKLAEEENSIKDHQMMDNYIKMLSFLSQA